MTEPKVSERMSDRVANFLASIVCFENAQDSVSFEDMKQHGNELFSAIAEIEQRAEALEFLASVVREHYTDIVFPEAEDSANATASDWITCAINELGNQHKRAERWKEAAVVLQNERLTRSDLELWITTPENIRNQPEAFSEAVERADKATRALSLAIAALGDEWDEAVRGEG